MIKFFRKIRYNLMETNKTGKYLKYAIGEVVLVIIGILIALEINEQTKKKDNNNLRNLYIIQLNDEVEQNINELIDTKNSTFEMLKELDTLLKILINKDHDNPKLFSKSVNLYRAYQFNPIAVTYENLKFSGDLKLFNDLDLRNSISNAYQSFNYIRTVEDIDENIKTSNYREYFMPNARLMDMSMSSNNFGKDAYFENMVLTRIGVLRQNGDAYDNSIELLNELKVTFSELLDNN